jgi:hypothetical protein
VAELFKQSQCTSDAKKPVRYFVHLYQTFRILLNFFYGDDIPTKDSSLASIHRLLKLFASDGQDLLQNYYEQRFTDQVGGKNFR